MLAIIRRCARVAATTLVAALLVGLPQAARADVPSLAIAMQSTGYGHFTLIINGNATEPSYVWVYHRLASVGACGATPNDEASASSALAHQPYAEAAGSFTEQVTIQAAGVGPYRTCGYVQCTQVSCSTTSPPVAFTTTTAISYACSEIDTTSAVTHFDAETAWDYNTGKTHGQATITTSFNDPGSVKSTAKSGAADPSRRRSGLSAETYLDDEKTFAGKTVDRTITYYPTKYDQCALDNGTVISTGPGSPLHGTPQKVHVTWNVAGQGASATVNGVLVPGSTTPHPVPSHKPVIAGSHRVGSTAVCKVTIPKGDLYHFEWFANGKTTNKRSSKLKLTGDLLGKKLKCSVFDTGTHGFRPVFSKAVKVRPAQHQH